MKRTWAEANGALREALAAVRVEQSPARGLPEDGAAGLAGVASSSPLLGTQRASSPDMWLTACS